MSHKDIIMLWKSPVDLAHDLDCSLYVARGIRERGWVPDWYWWDLVRAARRRRMPGVTFERLAKLARRRHIK